MKHDMNPHLPPATFDADEAVPAGGCESSTSRLELRGHVVIDIFCDKDVTVRRHYRQRVMLDKTVQIEGDCSEAVGGTKEVQASTVIIRAPQIRLLGDVHVQGDVHIDGTLRYRHSAPW